jgi:hypothetical protein
MARHDQRHDTQLETCKVTLSQHKEQFKSLDQELSSAESKAGTGLFHDATNATHDPPRTHAHTHTHTHNTHAQHAHTHTHTPHFPKQDATFD